jgi:hypothetical protein
MNLLDRAVWEALDCLNHSARFFHSSTTPTRLTASEGHPILDMRVFSRPLRRVKINGERKNSQKYLTGIPPTGSLIGGPHFGVVD